MAKPRFEATMPRLSQEYIDRYEDAGYWSDVTFVDEFDKAFASYPEQRVVGPLRELTYVELKAEVNHLASGLQALGIEPGDVISYQMPNWVTTTVVHLAAAKVGAVINPVTPIYRQSELEYILQDVQATCLFIPGEFRGTDYPNIVSDVAADLPDLEHVVVVDDQAEATSEIPDVDETTYQSLKQRGGETPEPANRSANDVHAVLYTSGTTGNPKGVVHTHNTLLAEERSAVEILGLSNETTVFMPSPVTHVTGLAYGIEMPFLVGMEVVYMDDWDPARAADLIEREDCNVTMGATPFLRELTDEVSPDWDSPLRVFSCGGADVPPDLVRTATDKLDCKVHRMYGLTEFSTITWPPLDTPLEACATTDGPPAPGAHIKIVDPDTGAECDPGESGELLAHGPELMVGYSQPELNEEAFDGPWFQTGDLATIRDGYVEITGRLKDIIIRGGENIPIKDVEDRLYSHPSIEDVAIVAMPDERMQEKGCAYVKRVAGESLTFEEMVEYLQDENIATQKIPERLELIDEFPRTASEKIKKNELRTDIKEKLDASE